MKKLEDYGVVELSSDELKNVEGGTILFRLLVGATGYSLGLLYKFAIAVPAWCTCGLGIGSQ